MSDTPFLEPGQALRDLKTLEAIDECPNISQRDLAQRLGIALGLTNACLAKMAKKGLVKISRVNSRNLSYHLTPAGFSAKARLSVEYARTTVDLYRTAKQEVSAGIATLADQGVTRVCLVGANDVAEIVGIVCSHFGMTIVCVTDGNPEVQGGSFMGHAVLPVEDIVRYDCDAAIVTYISEDPDFWVEHVTKLLGDDIPVLRAI